MAIETDYLERCIEALERAFTALRGLEAAEDPDRVLCEVYRAACVKEFELVLEQSGKLLEKRLRPWFAGNRQVDRLIFKDAFRHANKHGLMSAEAAERWLAYRDNRNDTAHDYGEGFAEATLELLPDVLADAKALGRRDRGGIR